MEMTGMTMVRGTWLAALASLALVAEASPSTQRGGATAGQPFRRMMVSHYGEEIDIEGDKVRPFYVIDVDVPAGGLADDRVSSFIGSLLCQFTNLTTAARQKARPHSDFGRALGIRRKMFFDRSRMMAFAGFAYLEGRTDLSDDRYIGYSLHENSWSGSKTGGDYYAAFGVFGCKQCRRLNLGDFFAPEKLPELDALIREAYAQRGPHANMGTFEEFRKKFPKDSGGMMSDPAANDSFSITPHGLKWAFFDAEIVGYLSATKEFPIEIEIPWQKLEPLLLDPALMPKVRF